MPIPFPCLLPNVTGIVIDKPFIRNIAHVFNSFPKLHNVDVSLPMHSKAWPGILPNRLPNYETVHVLRLNWIESKPLKQFAVTFPKLNELKLQSVDNELLKVVYEYFPQLSVLVLFHAGDYERNVTDEGITGLPIQSVDLSLRNNDLYIGNLTGKFFFVCVNCVMNG